MDYNEMKEKLRREGMAEQKSKFMSTAGTPAQTSMRYGSMTDAEEKASAAKPAPMFESAPPSEAKAPTATVRGVPEEMTAEYIPAAAKQSGEAPAAPSPATELAARYKKVDAELGRLNEGVMFGKKAGGSLGAAVGAGLGSGLGPFVVPAAGLAADIGMIGGGILAQMNLQEQLDTAHAARAAILREAREALRSGKITEEEWKAALSQQK